MQESAQDTKGIRLLAATSGILGGSGAAYLVCCFADFAYFYWGLVYVFLPFVVLGVIIYILWIRKPLSTSDAWRFVVYFWIPFVLFFLVSSMLYLISRS